MFVKNAFKTAFLVCASIIGAGFASGREIMEFFPPGILGLISANLSVLLICFAMYIVIRSSGEICKNTLYIWAVAIFSVCILSVMLAGTEEILKYGRFIMGGLVLVTVFFGIRGVENVSILLCPAMVLFILLFGREGIGKHASPVGGKQLHDACCQLVDKISVVADGDHRAVKILDSAFKRLA